jgi:hypothetical protein
MRDIIIFIKIDRTLKYWDVIISLKKTIANENRLQMLVIELIIVRLKNAKRIKKYKRHFFEDVNSMYQSSLFS